MERQYLPTEEATGQTGFITKTIQKWLRLGELRGHKEFGRPWRIKKTDFEQFCNSKGMSKN